MKILLVNPPDENKISELPDERGDEYIESDDFGLFPPLGILYVLSYLEEHTAGHELYFKDCVAEKVSHGALKKYVETIQPDVVGITSFTISLIDVIEAARNIRSALPGTHLCLGGHHPIAFPPEAAQLEEFDSVVVGEGEIAFTELVTALANGKDISDIQGVYTKRSVKKWLKKEIKRDKRFLQHVTLPPAYIEDIDKLPPPNRQFIDHINYKSIVGVSSKLATILSSRGCPYKCTFCDVPFKEYRRRDPKLVVDEIEAALALGYNEFHFYDDLFNIKPQSVIDLCDEIEKRQLKITWDFRGRVNAVNYESLRRFKNAGGRMISFGIETSSSEGLKVLRKGSKVEQNKNALKWCRELGIETIADFMLGLPHEKTKADIKNSVKTLISYDPDFAQFGVLSLYPNTQVYDQAVEKGLIEEGKWNRWVQNPTTDFIVDHWNEHLTTRELQQLQKWAYLRFYFRFGTIWRMAISLRSMYELMAKVKGAYKLLGLSEITNVRSRNPVLK